MRWATPIPHPCLPEHANATTQRVTRHGTLDASKPPTSIPLSFNSCYHQIETSTNVKMSSPASHRRQRSSQSGTPRRSSQRQAMQSSPPDPAAAQLQSEAISSQAGSQTNGTPRRAPQSSSPLKFDSSPAGLARVSRDVSSPLRHMTNTQTTQQDGERTPRASGLIGGQ